MPGNVPGTLNDGLYGVARGAAVHNGGALGPPRESLDGRSREAQEVAPLERIGRTQGNVHGGGVVVRMEVERWVSLAAVAPQKN